jgi:hypothetical protein
MAENNMFLEFNFRRGLFYVKMPNSKILIGPHWTRMLEGTIVPKRELRLKHYQSQKRLRIIFKGRPILCPNPKILEAPLLVPPSASGGLLCPVLIPSTFLLS